MIRPLKRAEDKAIVGLNLIGFGAKGPQLQQGSEPAVVHALAHATRG